MADEAVSTQVLLGEAGWSPSVEWNGKRYTLGHPTDKAAVIYYDALVEAEHRGLKAQLAKKLIDRDEYDRKVDDLGRAIDNLEHQEGGEIWVRYMVGKEAKLGLKLYLWSLFAQNHPDMTIRDVEALTTADPGFVKLALRRVAPAFFSPLVRLLKFPPEKVAELEREILARLDDVPTGSPSTLP